MEITKIKPGWVLLQLDGETVSVGEQIDVVDTNGRLIANVKVTSFSAEKAVAKIESGSPAVGLRAMKKSDKMTKSYSYDVRANPIGLISGAIDANFDLKISRNWTVGVQVIYLRASLNSSGIFNSNYNITAYGFGARANYFFAGAFNDGFYIAPSAEYLNVGIKTSDILGPASGSATGLMTECLLGYGWFWDGFNLMLGAGYGDVLGASGITIKDSVGNKQTITADLSGLTYELSFGWAF